MGYVSYQADIMDAKRNPEKSPRVPVFSSKDFEGKSLTQEIVNRILARLNEPDYLTIPEWAEKVRAYHEKRGGLPAKEGLVNIVAKVLDSLATKGVAHQLSGRWKVF